MLFVFFVTACFSTCYILYFGFLTRACVVWACVGFFVVGVFLGGGCYLPTYLPGFFYCKPGTGNVIRRNQTSHQRSQKTLKVSDRLRANRGGRVREFVPAVMQGRYINVSIPRLYITQQFIRLYITQQFICSRTCVLL